MGYRNTKSNSSGSSGGVGFLGLLQILFIGLKLTGHIDWSWWWVMSPMIGEVLIFCLLGAILAWMEK